MAFCSELEPRPNCLQSTIRVALEHSIAHPCDLKMQCCGERRRLSVIKIAKRHGHDQIFTKVVFLPFILSPTG